MGYLLRQLLDRQSEGRPLRVGLVGAGRFGTTVAATLGQMPGVRLFAVADLDRVRGLAALQAAGWREEDLGQGRASDAVVAGRPVLTDDATALATLPLDVLVEATGQPDVAATVIPAALGAGLHVVNVDVEADVLLGATFRRLADAAGKVYTLADGDQPACIVRLVDWARSLGYRIIACGRGTKRFPYDRAGLPEKAFARFGFSDDLVQRRRFNAQMYNSFRDGSKAQIEMTAVANALGLPPDRRGMHEPSAGLSELPVRMALRSQGGLLEREGVVDLANAVAADGESIIADAQANGVWVVLATDSPILREDLPFFELPASPISGNALLYRPYHMPGVETPRSIAEAALLGIATAAPLPQPTADVIAHAKRDLAIGERLDGSGGRTVYGLIERAEIALAKRFLPLGLAGNVTLRRAVSVDQPLHYDDVTEGDSPAWRLRQAQDRRSTAYPHIRPAAPLAPC
jgi:predicted homoserine dehydrogenase-like protein